VRGRGEKRGSGKGENVHQKAAYVTVLPEHNGPIIRDSPIGKKVPTSRRKNPLEGTRQERGMWLSDKTHARKESQTPLEDYQHFTISRAKG